VTSDAPAISAVPRRDWRIVGFYIFAFAAGGVVKPFLNLYLIEVGLSGSQIGVLQGGTAFVAVVVTPLIGVLADRTQRHRLLLAGIVFVKGLSAPLLLISNAWAWLATWVSVRVITSQVQDALMNRLTLAHLQAHKRTNLGSVRFWGALSFAATSLLAGWLARDDSVSVMFPLAGIAGTAAVLFVGAFPAQIAERSLRGIAQPSLPKRSPQLWFAFGIIFLFAFSLSGWETFGFVFLGEEMGAGNDVIGFLGAVSGLAPLPAFYGADWLIRRGGAVMAMAISFGALGVGVGGTGDYQSARSGAAVDRRAGVRARVVYDQHDLADRRAGPTRTRGNGSDAGAAYRAGTREHDRAARKRLDVRPTGRTRVVWVGCSAGVDGDGVGFRPPRYDKDCSESEVMMPSNKPVNGAKL
jgi:PPP family 3-phenylpropionic acid transporter